MGDDDAIRFGLTGLGGWAGSMCEKLLREGDATAGEDSAPLHMVAVCDPHPERFPERVQELKRRRIAILRSYDDLLDQGIDYVYLPLPIDLHRTYTERAVRAGKAVLCEKPAAGCVDDVDAMIAARDASGAPVAVAFQDVYQPHVHQLKRRLVAGEYGSVTHVSVIGCWPRNERYYARNSWAGRLRRNDTWILDSPACNALAHFIHLGLFLLGPSETLAASPAVIEAELYRANPIENYDTCSIRVTLEGGASMLVALSHACSAAVEATVRITTERAMISYLPAGHIDIRTDGRETVERVSFQRVTGGAMLRTLHAWRACARDCASRRCVGGTLEMARAHVVVMNAASEAARVVDLPARFVQSHRDESGAVLRFVPGVEQAMQSSIAAGQMLHESGLASWSVPAGRRTCVDYRHFAGPSL
jgi:predicted dehydrogenase